MKINVLIPTYNRAKYIKEAIRSILDQTYSDINIIVYDDGSTDNTVSIIKSIKSNRITLIKGEINKGVAHARNQLLNACPSLYACWQDSDDISTENRILYQSKLLNENTLVFCKWTWLKNRNGLWRPDQNTPIRQAFATVMFPVDKNILFKETMNMGGEDWDWLERMKNKYKEIIVPDEILYQVRLHSDRIGAWKKKIRATVPPELIRTLSYEKLIEYYKKHYEK